MHKAKSGYLEVQEASSGYQEVQKANSRCLEGHKAGSGYLEVQEEGCLHRTVKKNLCDDPFQTVPGSIPGSYIPAFTGTRFLNLENFQPLARFKVRKLQ